MLQTQVIRVITRNRDQKVLAIEIANESIHTVIRCKNVIASDDYPFMERMTEIRPIYGIYLFTGNDKRDIADKKDLREIIVIPATESHRAIYLLVVPFITLCEV